MKIGSNGEDILDDDPVGMTLKAFLLVLDLCEDLLVLGLEVRMVFWEVSKFGKVLQTLFLLAVINEVSLMRRQ